MFFYLSLRIMAVLVKGKQLLPLRNPYFDRRSSRQDDPIVASPIATMLFDEFSNKWY